MCHFLQWDQLSGGICHKRCTELKRKGKTIVRNKCSDRGRFPYICGKYCQHGRKLVEHHTLPFLPKKWQYLPVHWFQLAWHCNAACRRFAKCFARVKNIHHTNGNICHSCLHICASVVIASLLFAFPLNFFALLKHLSHKWGNISRNCWSLLKRLLFLNSGWTLFFFLDLVLTCPRSWCPNGYCWGITMCQS